MGPEKADETHVAHASVGAGQHSVLLHLFGKLLSIARDEVGSGKRSRQRQSKSTAHISGPAPPPSAAAAEARLGAGDPVFLEPLWPGEGSV